MTKKIIVETSARHIHLSDADLETLFGKGYQLTNKKNLSQPGQFACEEKVTVVGAKGEQKMSVLGPTRKATQVELSLTDAQMCIRDRVLTKSFKFFSSSIIFILNCMYFTSLLIYMKYCHIIWQYCVTLCYFIF